VCIYSVVIAVITVVPAGVVGASVMNGVIVDVASAAAKTLSCRPLASTTLKRPSSIGV